MPLALPALTTLLALLLVHRHRMQRGARAREHTRSRAPAIDGPSGLRARLPGADEHARAVGRLPAARCGSSRCLGKPALGVGARRGVDRRTRASMRVGYYRAAGKRGPGFIIGILGAVALWRGRGAGAWYARCSSPDPGRATARACRVAVQWRCFPRARCPTPMNAPLPASLLSAVELAPRDPILGVTEAFVADTEPEEGQSRRRRLQRRQRQGPAARLRPARRARAGRQGGAARLPADRRHRPPTTGGAERCCSAPTARSSRPAARSRCRRWAAPAGSRSAPISCAASRPARRCGSATRAGRTIARCSRAPASPSTPTPTTTRRRTASTSPACSRRSRRIPAGSDRRAARVLPQPDRRRPDAGAVGRASSSVVRARGLVPFLDLAYQGFARRHRRRRRRGAPLRRDAGPAVRLELVLEVVLALRRARRRAVRRRRGQGRGRARALAAEAPRPRQLLEPADARRADRRRSVLGVARAARAVGGRARDDARPHQADARDAGRAPARARCPAATSASCWRSAACSRIPASPRSRCSGCARSTRSTRSTPAASASRRSTRRNVGDVADAIADAMR